MTVDTDTLVGRLIERLTGAYVFPERAARAAEPLQARLKQGAYESSLGPELCATISADLLEASDDKHLRLLWHESPEMSGSDAELVAAFREQLRVENHGVRRVELLPENVGLIALTIIPDASAGGPSLGAPMQLVQHTRALILDLRRARWGSRRCCLPRQLPVRRRRCSPHRPHRGSARPDSPVLDVRLSPWPALPRPPVYVLTSTTTFSGAEALTYDLQAQGRAQIIGERTRGGAHPSALVSLTEQIELRLPVARPVNAVTGHNWEGVGIEPNVPTPAADAPEVALRIARETIAAGTN